MHMCVTHTVCVCVNKKQLYTIYTNQPNRIFPSFLLSAYTHAFSHSEMYYVSRYRCAQQYYVVVFFMCIEIWFRVRLYATY